MLRRRSAIAALAAGHTETASGCAIGLDYRSGRLVAVNWAQAERGVLLTGGDPIELDQIGLAIACAAMRRRKTVLVLDLSAAGARRDRVSCDRGHVSCDRGHASCDRGHVSCDPELLAPVMPRSMVGGRMKRFRSAGLDLHGASVCAQVARLAECAGAQVISIGSLADCAPVVPGAGTSGAVSLNGAFGRAIRRRGVVLVPAHQPDAARPDAAQPHVAQPEVAPPVVAQPEAARRAVSDLIGTLTSLHELGLRGDCLAWLRGCEAADVSRLSDLLALGHATGTAVSTTSPVRAAGLAAEAGLVVASGPIAGNLAQRLADLAVGNDASAAAMGPELPIGAPLWASIDNPRPSASESAPQSGTAKLALTDILERQHRNSATLIAVGRISGPVSFRTVPVR